MFSLARALMAMSLFYSKPQASLIISSPPAKGVIHDGGGGGGFFYPRRVRGTALLQALSIGCTKPSLPPPVPKPQKSHVVSSSPSAPVYAFPPLVSSIGSSRRRLVEMGMGFLCSGLLLGPVRNAEAIRIEYYATVGEKLCDMSFAKSGLGYCDIDVGTGVAVPYGELINVHYTARFADGTVFDSSYKRGRPLTMRLGMGKVIAGLDQGILGGGGVPPMQVGGKRKLMVPPMLAYGPEPAGCFSGDCNIPANATLLYDVYFVGIYK